MEENRIIIAGSRHFNDYGTAEAMIAGILRDPGMIGPVRIVSGHCRGADMFGERFAEEHGIALSVFPAEWKTYGRRAGYIRNSEMARFAAENGAKGHLIAFWDGNSRGTRMMIDIARRRGLKIHVFDLEGRAYSR